MFSTVCSNVVSRNCLQSLIIVSFSYQLAVT